MQMAKLIYRTIAFVLAWSLLIVSSIKVEAVPKSQQTMAELTVTGKMPNGEAPTVMVNGESVISGRSVASPAQLSVPTGIDATLSFGKAGRIELTPGTKINLTFTGNSITGNLSEGRVRIFSAAGTAVKINTDDAEIINDKNQSGVYIIEIVGFTTGISTEVGQAKLNGLNVIAGQSATSKSNQNNTQPTRPRVVNNDDKDNSMLFLLLGGGAAAVVAIILLAGGGDNNNTVSPVR
jgi:hypothetical protein